VAFKQGEPKYLVIADLDTEAHCLVINTEIHALYASSIFRDGYVPIDVQNNQFLNHDSFIDCNTIKSLSLVEINSEINADSDCLKGEVSDDVRSAIIEAIRTTPGLSPNEKTRYIAALGGE